MIPVVFINCKEIPFIDRIIAGQKSWETRNRNTLGQLVGKRVFLAETGRGKPVIRCEAEICKPVWINNPDDWDDLRDATCIPVGSKYDWKTDTKSKVIYFVRKVKKVRRFTPPEGTRHGRVWMEYEEV